jgi:hypothetical protein
MGLDVNSLSTADIFSKKKLKSGSVVDKMLISPVGVSPGLSTSP